jgi:hypothetical protein
MSPSFNDVGCHVGNALIGQFRDVNQTVFARHEVYEGAEIQLS